MGITTVIIISIIVVAIGVIVRKNKKEGLLSEGKIIERPKNFYKQVHCFTTTISDISIIGNALNKNLLEAEKITFTPYYDKGGIVFSKGGFSGTFEAALISIDAENELNNYEFQVNKWTETNGSINSADFFGANVLLTQIEKTIVGIDPNSDVVRKEGTYKTKTKFFG